MGGGFDSPPPEKGRYIARALSQFGKWEWKLGETAALIMIPEKKKIIAQASCDSVMAGSINDVHDDVAYVQDVFNSDPVMSELGR
jgi:hypothetical protein